VRTSGQADGGGRMMDRRSADYIPKGKRKKEKGKRKK
jgi:hypothetical protein